MKLRLNKNQVVNCTTQEEAEQCCQLADSMGLKWEDGGSYDETEFPFSEAETCYRFATGEYSDLQYYKERGNQILTTQDFLTMHTLPFMGYFESDGTKETGRKIIAVLEALGGVNSHSCNGRNHTKKQYFIARNNDIDLEYLYSVDGYHKCNLDHYMHLIDHSGDATEMVEKPNELADLRKQLAESVERERIANNIITEKRKEIEDNKNSIKVLDDMCTALNKALDEAKVKADKWDAIPQITVVKGAEDRGKEVLELLKPLQRWDNRSNFAFYENPESLYYFDTKCSMCAEIQSDNVLYNIFISTQNITELPPLDEKEEVEEFWLRLTDHYVTCYKKEDGGFSCWYISECINIYMKEEEGRRYLPFTAETEKLIGTTDKPAKKYEFMGCKKYFNTDELIKQLKGENK